MATLKRDREAEGQFDRFANIQSFEPPNVYESLIGTRLDVQYLCSDDETNEYTLH